MQIYLNVFGLQIPSYGLLIATGVFVANLIALLTIKKWQLRWEDLMTIEGYLALGMIIGAKILYLAVSYRQIDFSQIGNLRYLNAIMSSGFVFYGGLIGAFIALWLVWRIHKIAVFQYLTHFAFMIPLGHAFGRMGCFMAGCCYGIPYRGPFSVQFPAGGFAPAGVALFPVQAVEAVGLLLLAVALFILDYAFEKKYTVYLYLIAYSALRFVLEFYRYDAVRGLWGGLSTSQWISLIIVVAMALLPALKRRYYN